MYNIVTEVEHHSDLSNAKDAVYINCQKVYKYKQTSAALWQRGHSTLLHQVPILYGHGLAG